jgi:hypothetical protein
MTFLQGPRCEEKTPRPTTLRECTTVTYSSSSHFFSSQPSRQAHPTKLTQHDKTPTFSTRNNKQRPTTHTCSQIQ